jgi:hypothetical protein
MQLTGSMKKAAGFILRNEEIPNGLLNIIFTFPTAEIGN